MPLADGGPAISPFQIIAPTADPNTSRSAAIPVTTGFRRIQRHTRAAGETGRARFVIAANISWDVFSTQPRIEYASTRCERPDCSQNPGPLS